MSPIVRWLIVIAVGVTALLSGFYLHRGSPVPARDVPVKSEASTQWLSTELPDLTGKKSRLSDWQGKLLVVNFWATWCAPCREEMPLLIKAQTKHQQQGLQVIGIALDEATRVRPFSADIGVNYPILVAGVDGLEMLREAGNDAGALPFTVYIDRAGKIIKASLGQVTEKDIEKILSSVM